MNSISNEIIEQIKLLACIIPDETNWLTVKKALMLQLCPGDRQLFTRRDELTKKHFPFNNFEQNIRKQWKALTGNTLIMPDNMMLYDKTKYL